MIGREFSGLEPFLLPPIVRHRNVGEKSRKTCERMSLLHDPLGYNDTTPLVFG